MVGSVNFAVPQEMYIFWAVTTTSTGRSGRARAMSARSRPDTNVLPGSETSAGTDTWAEVS